MRIALVALSITILLLAGCAKASNPVQPTTTATDLYFNQQVIFPTEGPVLDFNLGKDLMCVAEDDCGFSVFDLNTGELKVRKLHNASPSWDFYRSELVQMSMEGADTLMYVYSRSGGSSITFLSLQDPTNPIITGDHQGETVSVTDMYIVPNDLNDPLFPKEDNPEIIYFINTAGAEAELHAYATTKINPVSYYEYKLPVYNAMKFKMHQEIAAGVITQTFYLACDQLGLLIVQGRRDLNDPNPWAGWEWTELSRTPLPGLAYDIAIKDNYAYLACYQRGLQVVDISNPSSPVYLEDSQYTLTFGYAKSIAVKDNQLALAYNGSGVFLFDLSTPAVPKYLSSKDDPHYSKVYCVEFDDDGYLYVGTRDMGVIKYDTSYDN